MNPEDSKISESFRALREDDAGEAPQFKRMMSSNAAKTRVAAWTLGLQLAVLAVGIVAAIFWTWKRPVRPSTQPIALADWRAPTDVLLTRSYSDLLRTTPRLGEANLTVKRGNQ
jgi:hypothetical protein